MYMASLQTTLSLELICINCHKTLRSTSRSLFCPRKAKPENYGCKALTFVAPKLWNSLPEDLKNSKTLICFKNKLKTHLFRKGHVVPGVVVCLLLYIMVGRVKIGASCCGALSA